MEKTNDIKTYIEKSKTESAKLNRTIWEVCKGLEYDDEIYITIKTPMLCKDDKVLFCGKLKKSVFAQGTLTVDYFKIRTDGLVFYPKNDNRYDRFLKYKYEHN